MIETINLTKKYGKFTALDSLNLKVNKGTVFGFVGHNGAGKSTTFSILSTLLAPTSGTALINGFDVTKNPKMVRKFIGYMPDFFGVYDQFKTDEYLDFYGASYGISYDERQKLIPQLLELVNLTEKKDTYVDVLSRGMKQRLCLARALIHDPEVLILDEPASGLDPRARIEMREILRELKSMGKTIMISSHILPELAEMCDEIGVINGGKLVATGRVEEIHKQLQANKVLRVLIYQNIETAFAYFEDNPKITNLQVSEQKENLLSFSYAGTDEEQVNLLKDALDAGVKILSLSQEESNLEDIFLEITKGVE
ncbi:ABC transporter ATP-binding protein [Sutcliffiella rhizosphaerae]|uniref:Linearmycin resistance ATP-binding protein LnrL n=1 Tax=Sutcliffiella rhizosphaerae TaxID=2880967 RepID=A0ABN8AD55_9BACI|nr:ABC transporter ATP-binding protein [Sutcliffiella rhizosphaerae]CAG9621992.1 Linearmycin resistance ATP-binding protein LnrL [Sutcliffiella rhizosphaerae]